MDCSSRRSSLNWLSSAAFFCCPRELWSTNHSTNAANKIATPINKPFILSPVRVAITFTLLYSPRRDSENSERWEGAGEKKEGPASRGPRQTPCFKFSLEAKLQRELKLPSIVRCRRLACRQTPRRIRRIANLVHSSDVLAVQQVERIRDYVQLHSLAYCKAPGESQIELKEPRRHIRVPSEISVAPSAESRDSGDGKRFSRIRQAVVRHGKSHAMNKVRRRTARPNGRPTTGGTKVEPEVRPSDQRIGSP